MSGSPQDVPEFAARFESGEPRRGLKAGVVVGAALAVGLSMGLGWWLSGDDRGRWVSQAEATPTPAARPAEPRVSLAAAAPDPAQVRRAYEEVQSVYAEGGAPALVDFSRECAETLEGDARVLDFCLAFDMYAQALAPATGEEAQWFAVGEARRLRLAGAALPPGAEPAARIAEVSQLMRRATAAQPAAEIETPEAPAVREAAPAPEKRAAAAPARKAPAAKAASRCKFEPTPALRILCANPQLKAADLRMQRAYRRAVAAGADREILDGEQAAWRALRNRAANKNEMAALYRQRMHELEQHVARAN
ncbi:hypothetical protein [Phenylobacterium sp.]|jgi:uncharacterized protein YecT (DUF1311 family)|uniref:hypothetical protein n=1 Tax=Phenylobacterium sp. TaxID=1871053 RepID=UPI002F938BB4